MHIQKNALGNLFQIAPLNMQLLALIDFMNVIYLEKIRKMFKWTEVCEGETSKRLPGIQRQKID